MEHQEEGEEEDYGLIRPSLIKSLRSILDQYPDDGQILKELIQNAEDAGAKEVKFILDDNEYGRESLYSPDMGKYQGPALYAYNDALFKEPDWQGIRMLQESVKEKDPMKVGRFGLGFKSVLHMTDFPSVWSGNKLQMIDPNGQFFTFQGDKTTGFRWNLVKEFDTINALSDQFLPYQEVLVNGHEIFQQQSLQGTLFRFPLRTEASPLSETLYTPEKVKELFASFIPHSETLLLFLKNLENIELLERKRGEKEPRLCFAVRVKDNCSEAIREKRRKFTQRFNRKKKKVPTATLR